MKCFCFLTYSCGYKESRHRLEWQNDLWDVGDLIDLSTVCTHFKSAVHFVVEIVLKY